MGLTGRTAKRAGATVGAVAVLSAVVLVTAGGPGAPPASAAALTPFDGCDELRSWFVSAASDSVGPYGLNTYGGVPMAAMDSAGRATAPMADEAASGLESAPVGPGATGTNVQQAGVDEPDLMKTHGDRVVLVRGDLLYVVDVSGVEPRELGRLTLPQGSASELLLTPNRALVLGNRWTAAWPTEPDGGPGGSGGSSGSAGSEDSAADAPVTSDGVAVGSAQAPVSPDDAVVTGKASAPMIMPAEEPTTVLTVVDLTDPAAPVVAATHEVEGGYLSARERDGVARVVLRSTPSLPFLLPQSANAEAEALRHNRETIQEATAHDWLPQRIVRDESGQVVETQPMLACADVSHPANPAGLGVLTVLTLDMTAPAPPTSVAVAADGDLVYASSERLYVATTTGGWGGPVPLAAAEPAMDMAFSGAGVAAEAPAPSTTRTQLHAFDVSSRTTSAYVASGEVEGWLLGRWAMSEYEGMLRVATTRGQPWGGPEQAPGTDAAVSVLEERGDELTVIGSVGGLGKGEQVRGVRWFGDVATVVTFRQTDPLYTVDLSVPTAPRVLGELKVPGYSAYLHPLGGGLLLGVGQDADETGRVRGAQMATFDLSDLAAPTRVDTSVQPDSWTDVESDSRQFTYLPDVRTAVVPISDQAGSALWAVRVEPDGSLSTAGRWDVGRDGWLVRALPVAGQRLLALTESSWGAEVSLLSVPDLSEGASTTLR